MAYSGGVWDASYLAFSQASAVAPLAVDDLDAMATSAWQLGHVREAFRVTELVYLRLVRTDPNSAARKAVELGRAWLSHGHQTVGQEWLDQARRLDPAVLTETGRHRRPDG